MMRLNKKAACFLLIGSIIGSVLCKQVEDDWLDPSDLLSYDPAKTEKDYQKYIRSKNQEAHTTEIVNNNEQHNRVQDTTDILSERSPLSQCERELLEIEKLKLKISRQPACETDFFKQFIAKLVLGFKHAHEERSSDESHFEIDVSITEYGMKTLEKFSQKSVDISVIDAHSVLSDMIKGFRQVNMHKGSHTDWTWWITSILQVTTSFASVVISVIVYWRSGIPWQRFLGSAFIIMFIVSVPWNWYSLYQKAVATRMAKSQLDVPPECTPENMPFWRSVLSGFTLGDPCKEYYETIHVDPWGEVPPTKAIAVTVTKFILEPMEHIGEAIGKMLQACVKDLPIQLWPVALGLVIFCFILILIMSFGYKIKFFHLLGLEPSHQSSLTASEKKILEEIKGLRSSMNDAVEQKGQTCIRNGEDNQDKMLPGEHSRPQISSSVECVKPANDRKKKKKQPVRVLSDSSVAAQCGHTREEDKCALKSRDMSGGDQGERPPPDGSGSYNVSSTSSRSDKGLTSAAKAAASVIPGFDALAKDTSMASLPPACDIEDVGSQESHKNSLRPSESSDDSDLEIIEEEPENIQP